MNGTTILLVGLPATGKSTFLAALWYAAEYGATRWKIDRLGEEDEHLQMISNRWLQCSTMERSFAAGQPLVSMHFKEDESQRKMTVLFPDVAGEMFEDQWVKAHCPKTYIEMARQANQILLFIHPEKLRKGERIEDYLTDHSGDIEGTSDARKRQRERDPTQVILVHLLQILSKPPIGHESLKVAVLVSAWDLIERTQTQGGLAEDNPNRWFQKHLPLLHQFLANNLSWIQYKVFGVSAQGGDYGREDEVERLRNMRPIKRIGIRDGSETTNDITTPMTWLVDG